jgi:Mrp family chromosome partitioning ATPase
MALTNYLHYFTNRFDNNNNLLGSVLMANCENCPSNGNCTSKEQEDCGFEKLNEFSSIKFVVAVMSGKGGVGKSSISVLLARELRRRGLAVGILDADITGPSIPRLAGISAGSRCGQGEAGIEPIVTSDGIKVVSLNFFLDNEEDPVVWRGPILSGAVKQFWTDVFWGELDCLVIDMPPGTGDVVLTVMQSLPLSAAVVVTTPHDLASMVVAKSVNMARMLNINVLGLLENMAYITCPDCGREIRLYDDSALGEYLQRHELELLGSLPLLPGVAAMSQNGGAPLEEQVAGVMSPLGERIEKLIKNR